MLKEKIRNKDINVAVIGLGYTGLPIATEMVKQGLSVTGIEIDEERVRKVNSGKSYISDISDSDIQKCIDTQKFQASSNYSEVMGADIILICLPTPLSNNKEPDLSIVRQSLDEIRKYKIKGKLVILESTVYPMATKEVALPALNNGYLAGKDYHLAYSPERVDPGNEKYSIDNTTRIVGGLTPTCSELAYDFFKLFVEKVETVSSPEVAETTKLFENIFRSVNIALVNEMMLLCDRMGIDVWEVIRAASTKEYGFMPFQPGPGLGGHCIPIDPHYLSWKAKEYGFYSEFIELAGKRNASMPYYVFSKISEALNERGKSVKGSDFLILGVAYKKDINDLRESPALRIIELLKKKGGEVKYFDPHIKKVRLNGYHFENSRLDTELIKQSDCVVVVTDHSDVDYQEIVKNASLVIDTRNALKGRKEQNIVRI